MSLIDLVDSGAIPALEMTMRFAAKRQQLIAHNVANIETPDFRQADVSVRGFQKMLADAVDRRREDGEDAGPLSWTETAEVRRGAGRELTLRAGTSAGGVLFHDRNNRDLERLMQDQAENVGAFRVAADLLRTRFDILRSAIAQRA